MPPAATAASPTGGGRCHRSEPPGPPRIPTRQGGAARLRRGAAAYLLEWTPVEGQSLASRIAHAFHLPRHRHEDVEHPDHGHWWRSFALWFPLTVYLVTRAINVVMFEVMQRHQIAMGEQNVVARVLYPTPAAPGYFVVTANWDGQWYHEIADLGYPSPLPVDEHGTVEQNPWAFYPVFPLLTRAVMWLTRADFYVAGSTLSLIVGAVALVMLFRLVDEAVGRWSAIVTSTAVSCYVAAPVLQTSYTESYALLVVVLTLMAMRGRRYGWTLVALVVLSLTRNIVLAMAPALLAHFAIRWLRRDTDPFPIGDRLRVLALTGCSVALTWLWSGIAGLVTGDPAAYAKTMAAWRVSSTEIKLRTWIDYLYYDYGYKGWVIAGILVALYAWFMLTHRTARWGPELWGWAGAYPAYQVLVTGIGPSRIRYALLAFPVALLIAWLLNRPAVRSVRGWLLLGLAVGGVVLQGWWIWNYWIILTLSGDIQFP